MNTFKKLIPALGFLIIVMFLPSCNGTHKITKEFDIVDSSTNIQLTIYGFPQERQRAIEGFYKTVYKRIDSSRNVTYEAFDYFTLQDNSFLLKEKVFLIIDNQVFPVKLNNVQRERRTEVSEEETNILTSDSVSVPVSDYTFSNKRLTRMSYLLSEEMVAKIRKANEVMFRYYVGPQMITIKLRKRQVRLLKELIMHQ